MKAVILAGGYAKRLWPITQEVPKALLEINKRTIIDYIIKEVEKIDYVDEIFISTNSKFETQFKLFIKNYKSPKLITLVVEPTKNEGEKLGAIGGLNYLINNKCIEEDLLIIAGDNMFEFNLNTFLKSYKDFITLAAHDINSIELAKKYGVIAVNNKNVLIDFEEKPQNPKSTLISTAVYIFPKKSISRIKEYLDKGNAADRVGDFISWIYKKEQIQVYTFKEKWFDIGCHDTLNEAKNHYSQN